LKISIDNNKNEQKIIYNEYDTNNNKKEEEQIVNEIKPESEDKNAINDINIKKEPEIIIDKNNTYTQIIINSNNYKNIKVLGQGSYGKIYLVEDIQTHQQFAMKKLILGDKLELRDNQDEYNMIMQITSTYPELNIIQVYGTETKNFDEYNFVFYVLMEVANCDWEKELLNRFRHQAFYTEEEIFYILQSLVDTFAYLQQIGICHRDIKPQNILCFGEKGYKISDFGEAKYRKKWRLQQSSVNYTSMQTVRGTELYMSPILYTALKTCPNKGATHNVFKSDVFSLGMCFLFASCLDYKCLYEVRKVNSMNKLQELVEKCVEGKYSQNFIDILLSMLQINEKERPDFIELSSMI
jgi:serine/threonine protein kinase